ncbi:MAG: carbohydrate porin, partial [Candidimonas sp.]
KARAADRLTFLAAAFAGDPAGRNCDDDPQRCNRHGTRFPLTGSTLWMGEMQVGTPPADGAEGFPGIYKLGAWYSNGHFGDQRYGRDGAGAVVPLSDPAADRPFDHKGNWGLYGVVDQTVWRGRSSSLSMFLRGGVSPSSRNLISTYADAGFGLKGPLTGRPDDLLTLGVAWAKISPDAVAADRDAAASGGQPVAVRRSEVAFELSYTAQMTPWWTLQPDLQYIVHPNGGQNPEDSARRLGNAFVVGLRTTIKF